MRLTGVRGADNGVVGDWLLVFDRHDNRGGYVAMVTLLITGRVRRLDSSLSTSPHPGT